MAVKIILKPGGIAVIALAGIGLVTPKILSLTSKPIAPAAPIPGSVAISENAFWASSSDNEASLLSLVEDLEAPSGTGRVAKIAVKAAKTEPWERQAGVGIPMAQEVGEKRTLRFWGKTDAPEARLLVTVEFNYEPYEKFASQEVTLTRQWKEYEVPVTFAKEVALGKGNIAFQLGQATKDCYFSGVRF